MTKGPLKKTAPFKSKPKTLGHGTAKPKTKGVAMTSKDDHSHKNAPTPPVKENPPQRHNPSPNIKDEPTGHAPRPQTPAQGSSSEHRDPVLGTVDPLKRETETLPVQAHPGPDRGEPVGHARHAETPEEVEKISAMEGFGASSDRKVPPPGSRHYVAGQPVDDEEWEKTEREANRLADAGREQRTEAEQRMKENTPGDPDYHPADPDKRDTPQAQGQDRDKRGPSDQPGQTNPRPGEDKDRRK